MHGFLTFLGIDECRLKIDWVSAAEGRRFAEVVTEFTEQLSQMGPLSTQASVQVSAGSDQIRETVSL